MADQGQLGQDFSVSRLLSPLPASTLPTLCSLAACVPAALLPPVLQQVAAKTLGVPLSDEVASNVVWKLQYYVPAVFESSLGPTCVDAPASMKTFQALAPCAVLLQVHNNRDTCPFCDNAPSLKRRESAASATVPNSLHGQCQLEEHRFRVYSLAAGVLFASFQESSCPFCKRFFLDDWCFQKGQARFGHMTDVQYIWQAPLRRSLFVIPKYRSYYAVEVSLLQHLTDTLQFAAGSLRSAVMLWARRHSDNLQKQLIFGNDFTLLPKVEEDLLMAWYTWNAVNLCGNEPRDCNWKFNADFDESLLQHVACIRKRRMDDVAQHLQTCPQCKLNPLVVLDGKYGARRMICASLQGTQQFDQLAVSFDTGCINFAPPGHFHCKACRKTGNVDALIRGQVQVTGMERIERPILSFIRFFCPLFALIRALLGTVVN